MRGEKNTRGGRNGKTRIRFKRWKDREGKTFKVIISDGKGKVFKGWEANEKMSKCDKTNKEEEKRPTCATISGMMKPGNKKKIMGSEKIRKRLV